MKIGDLDTNDQPAIEQVAAMLVDGFREHWPAAWPEIGSALAEVRESFGADRISRVALDDGGVALGWIGGIAAYGGNVWELHPLVVRADMRERGVGRALVRDLERQVAARGGLTITLGTDDEDNMTSLGGADLYHHVHCLRKR